MAKTPIDLNNFRVVYFGNADIERNYINDILHAIVDRIAAFESKGYITDAPSNGSIYGRRNGTWVVIPAGGSGNAGTVTSVDLAAPSIFSVSGNPITTSGTITLSLATQSANRVWAGPASGAAAAPTFRALVVADLPANTNRHAPGCVFSNGNLSLTGTLTDEIWINYSGTIRGWTILGDVAGSASITVSHATYAAYDTMTTLFTATVTTANKNQATGLSHSIASGDALRFSGTGFSSFTRCTIVLDVEPT